MTKYEISGIKVYRKTDNNSSFCEFTVAVSRKQAVNNIKSRLKGYDLRDVSIIPIQEMPDKPKQLRLAF